MAAGVRVTNNVFIYVYLYLDSISNIYENISVYRRYLHTVS